MAPAHFPCLSCSPRQTEVWLSTKGYGNAEPSRAEGRGQAGAKAISMTEEKPSSGIWMSQGRARLHRWVNGATRGSASRQCLSSGPRVSVEAGAALPTWDLSMETPCRAGKEWRENREALKTITACPQPSAHAVGNSPRDRRRGNIPYSILIPPQP